MMLRACFFALVLTSCSTYGSENAQVPVYDYNWEDLDTDYDQICEVAEYEKPSKLTVWFRSVGGALYAGICSARDYVAIKWYAMRKLLWRNNRKAKKITSMSLNSSGRTDKQALT